MTAVRGNAPVATTMDEDASFLHLTDTGSSLTLELVSVNPRAIELYFRVCTRCWERLSLCVCHDRGYD